MNEDRPTPSAGSSDRQAPDPGPAGESRAAPTPQPASMKGFLILLGILAVVATAAFLLLGDALHRWFPRE